MSLPSSSSSDPSVVSQLLATAHWAALAHGQQRRKSGSQPAYIQHPLHVASLLASPPSSLCPDPPLEILQAAILHDTVEDTDVTEQDLQDRFGPVVTRIGAPHSLLPLPSPPLTSPRPAAPVMECSDDKDLSKEARKQAQIDSAPHKSDGASASASLPSFLARARAKLFSGRRLESRADARVDRLAEHVKLADKLSNLTDLMSPEGRPAGWSVKRIQVRSSLPFAMSRRRSLLTFVREPSAGVLHLGQARHRP